MQIGNAIVGVDHGQGRASSEGRIDGRLNCSRAFCGKLLEAGVKVAQSKIGIDAYRVEVVTVFIEDVD